MRAAVRDWLVNSIALGCGLLVLLGGFAMITRRPLGVGHLIAAALVELAVLVQVVLAVIDIVRGAEVESLALFIAYAGFAVIVLPAGALWAVGEKNRWSGAVLGVAALALVVTMLRLDAVWLSPNG
jgi:hypothetical protein